MHIGTPVHGSAYTPGRSVSRSAGIWRALRVDPPLLLMLLLLCCVGLVVLFSANDGAVHSTRHQAWAMLAGLLVMLVAARVNVRHLRNWAVLLYLAVLGLLGLVLLVGVEVNGARSWLNPPGLPSFQPSELMKFALPGLVAAYLVGRPLPPRLWHVLCCMLVIMLPTGLIVLQNDAGTGLMVAMSGMFVLLLAGMRWSLVGGGALTLLLASPIWYFFLARPHQQNRILAFFDPYSDPAGAGYNIIQSQIAIGSGGVYGKGYMQGAQSHLDFIPESNTDFILAVLAEEFGLLGVLLLIALYSAVILRGFYIAFSAKDMFSRLLAGSITLTLFLYVFVNMAMVSGMLPVIGVPLPLISRGGTSVVTLFIGFGLLMSIQADSTRLRQLA